MDITKVTQLEQLGISGIIVVILIWVLVLFRKDNMALVVELTRTRKLYEDIQEIRIIETRECMKESNTTLGVLKSAIELTKEVRSEAIKNAIATTSRNVNL